MLQTRKWLPRGMRYISTGSSVRSRGSLPKVLLAGRFSPPLSRGQQSRHALLIRRLATVGPRWPSPGFVWRSGPRQQGSRLEPPKPPAAHALGDQAALVLRYGAPDLQQQPVVWVLAHGSVKEFHLRSMALQLLHEQ